MKGMHIDDLERVLTDLGACEPAMTWLRSSGCQTFEEAWNACPRGAWLLWVGYYPGDSELQTRVDDAWDRAFDESWGLDFEARRATTARVMRALIPAADVERVLRARLEAIPCR